MQQTRILLLTLIILLSSGCASVKVADERDPLEGFNRALYAFNDDFDRAIGRPVAEGYNKVVPEPINNSISNFFSNIDDVTVLVNDILQLKFEQTLSDMGRITFNTTFGLLGLFDVATHMDLPKHNEDFGQTLGRWGVGSGPYIVLPFLGPSTLRDTAALPVDWQLDPLTYIEDPDVRLGVQGLKYVDIRAGLLRASRLLDTASLDPYVFMRDAYLQRRQNLVYDGNPPQAETEEEFDPFSEEFDPLSEEEFDPLSEEEADVDGAGAEGTVPSGEPDSSMEPESLNETPVTTAPPGKEIDSPEEPSGEGTDSSAVPGPSEAQDDASNESPELSNEEAESPPSDDRQEQETSP